MASLAMRRRQWMASGCLLLIVFLAVGQCATLPVKGNAAAELAAHKKIQAANPTCFALHEKNLHKRGPYRYVPACTKDGNFEKVQCYWKSIFRQMCWCVDPLTGGRVDKWNQRFLEHVLVCPKRRQKRLSLYEPGPIITWPTLPAMLFDFSTPSPAEQNDA